VQAYGFPHVLANMEDTAKTPGIIFVLRTLYFGCEIIKFDDTNQTVKSRKHLE
jgi:hypothetical protein